MIFILYNSKVYLSNQIISFKFYCDSGANIYMLQKLIKVWSLKGIGVGADFVFTDENYLQETLIVYLGS